MIKTGVSILKDREGVFLYADFSLVHIQFNSIDCWKLSRCDKEEKPLRSFELSIQEFILKIRQF